MEMVFTKPKLLLVEGEDDARFLSEMLRILNLNKEDDFQIKNHGGKQGLPPFLAGLVGIDTFRRNVRSLGIVRDADEHGEGSARQAIRVSLHNAGLSESQNEIKPTRPALKITTHIMCDSSGKGRLEEMLLESVEHSWRTSCVNDYWQCLEKRCPDDDRLPKDENKARLAVFLASHQSLALKPGFEGESDDTFRLDHAVQRHYLNLNHANIKAVSDFLLNL
jgi:hypothetical protein